MKAANEALPRGIDGAFDKHRTVQPRNAATIAVASGTAAANDMLLLPSGGPVSGNASVREVDNGMAQISLDEESLADDNDVEMPDIDEIEESTSPAAKRGPIRRSAFKSRKMMGNTKYRGKDRIWPHNFCFTIFTAFMIIIPSIPAITVV